MSEFKASLVIILIFFAATAYGADRNIYTWTDERGNLHMTDEPPPSNAKIKEVETYQDQTPEAVEARERTLEELRDKRRIEDLEAEAARAQRGADAAEQSALKALERAETLTSEAQDYIKRFGNTPSRRQQFKYKIQAKKDMAEAAQEAAREARVLADQSKIVAQKMLAAAEEAAKQSADSQQAAASEEELRLDE